MNRKEKQLPKDMDWVIYMEETVFQPFSSRRDKWLIDQESSVLKGKQLKFLKVLELMTCTVRFGFSLSQIAE